MATSTGPEPAVSAELSQSVEAPQASVFDCIRLLVPTAGSVASQFRSCQRISQFPLDQVAFWSPELVHVFVTCETESAAVEDASLTSSQRSTHVASSVFWFLQSSLHDLKHEPHSPGFVAARRLTNRMQHMSFATGELPVETVMHENPQPAMILAGMVGAAIGMPRSGKHMKPLVESQGRKQRSAYSIRRVVSKITARSSAPSMGDADIGDAETRAIRKLADSGGLPRTANTASSSGDSSPSSGPTANSVSFVASAAMGSQPNLSQYAASSSSTSSLHLIGSSNRSMPNLTGKAGGSPQANSSKTNYFRCETQFVYALNAISVRLMQVPKEARQSALQVELALSNEDLPDAEVDSPMSLPQRYGKQNRIVRICTSEATVSNSAEKAPFLSLIEYLRGELTFDPQKPRNREILRSDPKSKTHIFERPSLTVQSTLDVALDAENPGSHSRRPSMQPKDTPYHAEADTPAAGDAEAGAEPGADEQQNEYEFGYDNDNDNDDNENGPQSPQVQSGSREVSVDTRRSSRDEDLELDISEVSSLEREEKAAIAQRHYAYPRRSTSPPGESPIVPTELSAATQVAESRQYAEGPSAADLATQWRTASLILAQLDGSTNLPKQDVQAIRQRIIKSMQDMQKGPTSAAAQGEAGERRLENDSKTSGLAPGPTEIGDGENHLVNEDDPSAANLGEDWQSRKARIRRASKFGHHPNWDLVSVIVKTGDDLRQEALASQLIQRAAQIWKQNGIGVWVRRMMILITSANSGSVETITNASSLHSIKKALTTAQVNDGGDPRSIAQLTQHFESKFGPSRGSRYQRAVHNFVESSAAYSISCYVSQIKDRHNGNILVDAEGHIIHIDFGFMLSNSPGHLGFEANTFKLTQEYVDLMGGVESEHWAHFMDLVVQAFLALKEHTEEFVSFLEIMGTNSTSPCFQGGALNTAQALRQRLMPELGEEETKQAVERMVWKSYGSYYTRIYDQYQMATQGIYN